MTDNQPRREGLARGSKYEPCMAHADSVPGCWVMIGDEYRHPQTARAWFRKLGYSQTSRKNVDEGTYTLWIRKDLF